MIGHGKCMESCEILGLYADHQAVIFTHEKNGTKIESLVMENAGKVVRYLG